MKSVFITVCLCAFILSANASLDYDDGGYHTISSVKDHTVYIDQGVPDAGTTVEISLNGVVTGDLYINNKGHLKLTGGQVQGWVESFDQSLITLTSGSVLSGLNLWGTSEIKVTDATISGTLYSYDESTVSINGGSFGALKIWHTSRAEIRGGTFSGMFYSGNGGFVYDQSVITFYGSEFKINGQPVPFGTYTGYDYGFASLTGVLENGDVLNNHFIIDDSSSIVLVEAVPEPGTLVILSAGLLGIVRKRK